MDRSPTTTPVKGVYCFLCHPSSPQNQFTAASLLAEAMSERGRALARHKVVDICIEVYHQQARFATDTGMFARAHLPLPHQVGEERYSSTGQPESYASRSSKENRRDHVGLSTHAVRRSPLLPLNIKPCRTCQCWSVSLLHCWTPLRTERR